MSAEKQYEVLEWAFSFLKKHDREEKVAEILLQHHLHMSRTDFFMNMQELIPVDVRESYINDIKKHALTGIPVQHITGEEYFYGRQFHVNKHVLVPRYETEELVHHVIELVKVTYEKEPITIVDVGTGSGVIAITLALELPRATVYATDISEEALQVAKRNAIEKQASVQFLKGDFLQPIIERGNFPHIIVSNPPYIKKTDETSLSDTVRDYDPPLALFAENEGLKAYEEITEQAKKISEKLKFIYFEIGFDQAKDVTAIVRKKFPHSEIRTIKDINDKDRVIAVTLHDKK